MVTLTKYARIGGGEIYNRNVLWIEGLSSESKPTSTFVEYDSNGKEVGRMPIENGSIYSEINTGKTYKYDAANATWYEFAVGGGGCVKPEGGIILVGETTTPLTDGATTNPIMVDGQSYTAQPNNAVIYGNKEFLYTGARWIEFGDVSEITDVIAGIDHTENNYIEMKNGVRLYISSTAPTGNIPDGSVGVGW